MWISALTLLSIFTVAAQAGKRGLAWPWYNGALDASKFSSNSQVAAIYDWETYAPPTKGSLGNLGFIGMQRCLDCSSSPISALYSRWQAQQWATVFTLNEPDINGISPSQAASWYIQHINMLPIKKALPAVTSSTAPNQGLQWLTQMMNACNGQCQYDYCNLHWYGGSFQQFQSYVESAHTIFPHCTLVITEFALQDTAGGQAAQISFFEQAFSFLDNAYYVELYFPFVATSPSLFQANDNSGSAGLGTGSCLFNDDGSPSAVGELMM